MTVSDKCKFCLYIHVNLINGKIYVGITSQAPEKRWLNGMAYEKRLVFGRAVRKYGWHNFDHRILMRGMTEAHAKAMERYMISMLNTQDRNFGYNMTEGGEGVCGLRHSEESKKKMSIAKSGPNNPHYGKHRPESTRRKLSESNKGKHSDSKFSEYALKRSIETKKKPVEMVLDGIVVQTFDSAKSAQENTGISRKNISLCCLGHRKHVGGYEWKFA